MFTCTHRGRRHHGAKVKLEQALTAPSRFTTIPHLHNNRSSEQIVSSPIQNPATPLCYHGWFSSSALELFTYGPRQRINEWQHGVSSNLEGERTSRDSNLPSEGVERHRTHGMRTPRVQRHLLPTFRPHFAVARGEEPRWRQDAEEPKPLHVPVTVDRQ